jgi:hypothetical protein
MDFPLARDGIPIAEGRALRGHMRRTTLLRAVFGLALLGALANAFLLTRDADAQRASLVPDDTTAALVLDLSASIGDFGRVGDTLRRVAREEEHAGLVIFSNGAYELLPPGTPGRELEPFARFFTPGKGGEYPTNPWDATQFRGGTSISSGLAAARAAFDREGVSRGSILLASDLDVEAESERVSEAVVALRRDGIQLRVIPVDAAPRHVAFFERLLGRAAFLAAGDEPDATVATTAERRLGGVLPWGFLAAAVLGVALLAANERLLSRFEVRS